MNNNENLIKDCFTENNGVMDLEVNNITTGCISSKTNKFNLDEDGNLTVKSITATEQEIEIDLLDKMYPLGAIYISAISTNPSTIFGGSWQAWGEGRVPVGINTADTDFNTTEKVVFELWHRAGMIRTDK